MRLNFRFAASLALIAMGLAIGVESVLPESPAPTWSPNPSRVLTIDLCQMVEQIPVSARAAGLAAFLSIIASLFQGFRNRAAPRWLAVAGLVALPLVIHREWWRIAACHSGARKIAEATWLCAAMLLLAHHAFHRTRSRAVTPVC